MHKSSNHSMFEFSLEMQLIAACCVHPVTPRAQARIEQLAAKIPDWKSVWQLGRRHQVQGLLQDRLARTGAVPPAQAKRWAEVAKKNISIQLQQAHRAVSLHHLLKRENIPNLVLKGVPLTSTIYGSLAIRRSIDIDLLVMPEQAWEAVQMLAQQGFVPQISGEQINQRQFSAAQRHYKEITLSNQAGEIVDLHWRLVSPRSVLSGIAPFANSSTVAMENLGEVTVLGEEDQFAYLCAHGALSDWAKLKWIADVNALLEGKSDQDIEGWFNHADRLGAGACALQALGLREMIWDAPMSPSLSRRVDLIGKEQLLSYPIHRLHSRYHPENAVSTLKRLAGQWSVRSVLLQSRSAASRDAAGNLHALPDILSLPLPASLDWLYPPLRPLFWTARKLRG